MGTGAAGAAGAGTGAAGASTNAASKGAAAAGTGVAGKGNAETTAVVGGDALQETAHERRREEHLSQKEKLLEDARDLRVLVISAVTHIWLQEKLQEMENGEIEVRTHDCQGVRAET